MSERPTTDPETRPITLELEDALVLSGLLDAIIARNGISGCTDTAQRLRAAIRDQIIAVFEGGQHEQ